MNTTVMAGEVTTPKKVAFVNRKSANSDRIEQDEKELKKLLEEKENVNKESTEEVEAQEAEPINAEERKEYRGKWMGFTDKSRLDSMIEFPEGDGPDGQTFMKVETAELMLDI